MKTVLTKILNDPDHPTTSTGKKVNLIMKYGMNFMGTLRPGPTEDIFEMTALMLNNQNPNSRPEAMTIYFDVNDVAVVMAPAPENKITVHSGLDISKLRPDFK